MSELGQPVTLPETGPVITSKPVKSSKLWQLILFTIVFAALVFMVGVTIGNKFFWNQFDRTPIADRQYKTALDKVKVNPTSADSHVALGWALFQKGQYNDALAEYQKALSLDDKNFMANLNLGLAYRQVNKNDLAVSTFQKTVALAPKSFEAHYYLGLSYQQVSKLQDSLDELNLAYKLNPGSTDVIYDIGQCYEKMGKLDDAKKQYNAVLEFDPNFVKAKDALKRLGVK